MVTAVAYSSSGRSASSKRVSEKGQRTRPRAATRIPRGHKWASGRSCTSLRKAFQQLIEDFSDTLLRRGDHNADHIPTTGGYDS